MSKAPFTQSFVATPDQIDELGHVNNAEWVRWAQALSVAHWHAEAEPAWVDAYVWMVTRHAIDYRGNIHAGESVVGRTWIPEPPRGARFDRLFAFDDASGKTLVEGRSTWVIIDRTTGRITRIPPALAERFCGE